MLNYTAWPYLTHFHTQLWKQMHNTKVSFSMTAQDTHERVVWHAGKDNTTHTHTHFTPRRLGRWMLRREAGQEPPLKQAC